jgi:hypothetical protein
MRRRREEDPRRRDRSVEVCGGRGGNPTEEARRRRRAVAWGIHKNLEAPPSFSLCPSPAWPRERSGEAEAGKQRERAWCVACAARVGAGQDSAHGLSRGLFFFLLADSLTLFVAVSWDFLPLFLRSIARAVVPALGSRQLGGGVGSYLETFEGSFLNKHVRKEIKERECTNPFNEILLHL